MAPAPLPKGVAFVNEVQAMTPPHPIPSAPPRKRTRRKWLWLVLASLSLVGGIVATFGYKRWQNRGRTITVHFRDVYGLRPGAQVRYRGMVVAEVMDVALQRDLATVDLKIRFPPETSLLARSGSKFWIVRPTASLATGIGGLDTLVGDLYVAVQPGMDGPDSIEFTGDEEPPPPEYPPDCLRIKFRAKRRPFGLRLHAPIVRSGTTIGLVRSVELSADGKEVLAEAFIFAQWAPLVHIDSVFRAENPLNFEGDILGGIKLRFDIQGLSGGVELQSSDTDSAPARNDQVFLLGN